MSLQLVSSVGIACVVMSVTVNYGRFRSKLQGIHGVPMSRSFPQS